MSRIVSRGTQVVIDLLVLSLAYWLSYAFRFEFDPNIEALKLLFFTWPYVVALQYLVLLLFGVPRFAWRYMSLRDAKATLVAIAVSSAVLVALRLGLRPVGGYTKFVVIPLGVLAIDFVLAFVGITGVRALRRLVAERAESAESGRHGRAGRRAPTMLIGAGEGGLAVAKEITRRLDLGIEPVGFLDDDPLKVGTVVHGLRVFGTTAKLAELCAKAGAQQVLITIARAGGRDIRRITMACEEAGLPAQIIPGLHEIVGGSVNLSRIRNVEIEDLLRRKPVALDVGAVSRFVAGRSVMVTGAGGSIGSEICRQVAGHKPKVLVLIERHENALFEIHRDLTARFPTLAIEPWLADITDRGRLEEAYAASRPSIVYHAAAHKHVPMMEWNPGEAIKNNVFGTKMVVDLAREHRVDHFVMISTDKAVNPTSIMGATKRVAELYVQAVDRSLAGSQYVSVRFGNVLGSSGSVVPIFKSQIALGGPVTVTHPEMKRYFMTIPEACQLVLQAGAMGNGGEIFILDMGEPVRIVDLASDLIRLSGFKPGDEIEIVYTGFRPGEKLVEEIANLDENANNTAHPKIFIGRLKPCERDELDRGLEALGALVGENAPAERVRECLSRIVPEFRPSAAANPQEATPTEQVRAAAAGSGA